MIRQGLVHSRGFDNSTMNNPLPPLNTLPQWSRINAFDKARYPKPFIKDHKLNATNNFSNGGLRNSNDDEEIPVVTEMNPSQRIQYLERSILFMRQQHSEMLHALHEEAETLKKENKDLQFKIIMNQKTVQEELEKGRRERGERYDRETINSGEISPTSSYSKLLEEPDKSTAGSRKTDQMRIIFLEEEVKELKRALRETRNRNQSLSQFLEQAEEQRKRQQGIIEALKFQLNQGGVVSSETSQQAVPGSQTAQSSGQPLTLQQCHALIKHLQQVNDKQSHELERLKLDLRDVLYSHKWTPDAYLMAKAYVAEDNRKEEEKRKSFPRIPLKTSTRKLPEIAYVQDSVSLPALRQTMGNKAIERRKRTQVLQQDKLKHSVLP